MSRDDDGWKPGPPPLDEPGRYDCRSVIGGCQACEVVDGEAYFDGDFLNGRYYADERTYANVAWHFPIPSPPAP
jgi:hypothetical protein